MKNPLNELPPDLTQEAIEDKKIFHAAIATAKGKVRRDMIIAYCDRYKEVPHLEPVN